MATDTWGRMGALAQAANRPRAMTCVDVRCVDCGHLFHWSHLNRLTEVGIAARAPKRCPDCWLAERRARDRERVRLRYVAQHERQRTWGSRGKRAMIARLRERIVLCQQRIAALQAEIDAP